MSGKPYNPLDASAPEWAGPQLRPSFFAYGETPAHYPNDDLSRSAMEVGGAWIYVIKGRFVVKQADRSYDVREGESVLYTNPATATLIYPEKVKRVTVGFYGSSTAKLFEWFIERYGSFHRVASRSLVVSKAIELSRCVQRQPRTSAHIWSVRLYNWMLLLWKELEGTHDPTAEKVRIVSNSRLLGLAYPNFKAFAKAMGYDPAYLSRSLEKSWAQKSPVRALRWGRMQKAENLLRTTSLSVRQIASEVCYSGPESFTAAFRKAYGMPPLRYRHAYRLGKLPR